MASTAVFAGAAALYVMPLLPTLDPKALLVPILLLHAQRHIGLMFLAPGAVRPGMPRAFAESAAWGDVVTALLAAAALVLVLRGSGAAVPALWIFNVVGTFDLVRAIVLATRHRAAAFMGATYWLPAMAVPLLLVTHGLVFAELLR